MASHVSNGRALGEAIELWLLTSRSHLTVGTQLVSSFSETCWLVVISVPDALQHCHILTMSAPLHPHTHACTHAHTFSLSLSLSLSLFNSSYLSCKTKYFTLNKG